MLCAGYMVYPISWQNYLGYGLTLGAVPDPTWNHAWDGVDYPPDYLPEEICEGGKPPCMTTWMFEAGEREAFTNYTFITGEATLGGYSIVTLLTLECFVTLPNAEKS